MTKRDLKRRFKFNLILNSYIPVRLLIPVAIELVRIQFPLEQGKQTPQLGASSLLTE